MKNKIKIVNLICLAISCITLLLEAMPKSVDIAVYVQEVGQTSVVHTYTSYFIGSIDWSSIYARSAYSALLVASFTILNVILNVISLFKVSKAVSIATISATVLAFICGMPLMIFTTAFNATITVLLILQLVLQGVMMSKFKFAEREVVAVLICFALSSIALLLEAMPKSVKNGSMISPDEVAYYYHSYFIDPFDFIRFFASATACFTVIVIMLNIVGLFKNGIAINIVSVVATALAVTCSIVLVRFSTTAYSVIVAVLFLAQFALQTYRLVRLKLIGARSLKREIKEELAIE
ncbi:MAG: hypothetical protein K2G37_05180 [Clostridia bacterium]|nr:hypothetical protein [Clostridia bacterium]MDE7328953.1 hypothetical protein [Clostridia bacterium]